MIDSIHQSSLSTALRCGEQFRRRYIDGEIIPPGVAAGRGTGVHEANRVNLTQKIKSGKDLSLDDLQDACRDGYMKAFRNGVYMTKEDEPAKSRILNDGLNDALRCTKIYRDNVAPEIEPVSVEDPFEIDVGLPLNLAGTVDIQRKRIINDLKTTSMKWPEDRIKNEIQPIFYSFVKEYIEKERPEFRYDILIARRGKDGNPTSEDYQPLKLTATDKDYNALFAKISVFLKMLEAGIFPPCNPSDWVCSPKWCGYYATCIYRGNKPQKKWF